MVQFIRHYLLAVQFFTRIPVTGALAAWTGYSPAMLRASAAHFPGIGWLVGAAAAGTYALFMAVLPLTLFTPLVAAALSTVATALLTGAFHEDGLADVSDGLGGSSDAPRALEIMKDSRVGAFGALALVLVLACKLALIALLGSVETLLGDSEEAELALNPWLVPAALFAAHVVSRGLPLLLIRVLPHVGDTATSKSKPLADQISLASLGAAFLWCFMALALASYVLDAIALIAGCSFAVVALLWMGRLFSRRLQGFTGDCLGATQQVCEVAFYLGLAIGLA
ncbi:adenosylcobinamide-GDP ribazoletransferase [Polaromonas sp.]|uniref:adenosylcobinamide-GDP ribazoletransferase n=1 Tax=Polaromonas sp. TaxID=1869339 RepID=UPI00273145FE|nr:adenosylcobinamide-GDP ribazoletransferase [Polaromonas sp.]MDP1741951.1 adenosylcobinamide-GDP ribazoletransferase [Polaromonas sp.]